MRKLFFTLLNLLFIHVVIAQLNANFTANVTEGCGSLAGVQFTTTSTGNITSWRWEFGNGNTSNLQNPQANFNNPNFYNVKLIVGNGTQFDSITKNAFIKVYNNPTADFTSNTSTVCVNSPIRFTDASTQGDNPIQTYFWDFKDGSTSPNIPNITHTYQVPRNYSPTLQVIDSKGCTGNVTKGPIQVLPAIVADFTTSGPTSACTNTLTVDFLDNSIGSNLTYNWEFGDGTTSTLQSPTHTYTNFGNYSVRLSISNSSCTDVLVKNSYVVLAPIPVADFSVSKKEFCKGDPIQFIGQTTNVSGYSWNFGDGTTSFLKNPIKIYSDSGIYVISLQVSIANCSDIYTDTIRIEKAIANYVIDTNYLCNFGDTVRFIDQSYNAVKWRWVLHSGVDEKGVPFYKTDSTQNPFLVNKNQEGFFSDSLIVESPLGCLDTLILDSSRYYEVTKLSIVDTINDRLQVWEGCFPRTLDFNSLITPPINAGTYTYSWFLDSVPFYSGPDPTAYTFTDDTARLLVLKVISSNGCETTDSTVINLGKKIPPIVSFKDTMLCENDTFLVNNLSLPNPEIDNTIYQLVVNNGTRGVELESRDSTVSFVGHVDVGYFNLSVINVNDGCEAGITIDSAVFIKGPIASARYSGNCLNRKQINFTGIGRGATRFQWDFGDTTFNTSSLNPTHNYSLFKNYTFTFTAFNDTNGCPPSVFTKTLSIIPPSIPTIFPPDSGFCFGDFEVFSIINFADFDSIQWKVDGVVMSDSIDFLYRFDSPGNHLLEIIAIDAIGCEYTSVKSIFVSKPIAKVGFITSNNCLPLSVTFKDSTLTDTLITSSFFTVNDLDTIFPDSSFILSQQGIYDINFFVRDTLGCRDSLFLPGAFNLKPFSVSLLPTSTTEICEGQSITFVNSSSDTAANYVWNFGDGVSVTTKQKVISHTFDTSGQITILLTGTNSTNCTKSDSIRILIEKKPEVGFTADTMISTCYPLQVQFQDTSKGAIVSWLWQIDTNVSIFQNPKFNFENIGKFDVSLKVTSANGCADSITKPQYIQTNGPTAEFTINKKEGCVNDLFTFSLINPINVNQFVWDFGDGNVDSNSTQVSHIYKDIGTIYPSLILLDSSGKCDVSIIDSLQIFDAKADFTIQNDSGCTPLASTFKNTSIGASSFKWNFGSGFEVGDSSELKNYSVAGNYAIQLAITSSLGCVDTATKIVQALKTPDVTIFRDTGICIGDSIQLTANGNGTYLWSPSQFLTNNTIANPIAFPNKSTFYHLALTAPNGCVKDTSAFLRVIIEPNYLTLNDTNLIIGEELKIIRNYGDFLLYSWSPNIDISCIDCPNPTIRPLESRTYYFTIKDKYNCFEILDSIYIEVDEKYSLDVPNAFSPNGDGNNDVIYAKGWGLKELLSFKIYNRFGELVFESTDFKRGWDGYYKGKLQNIETYVYTVEALSFGGKVLNKKGNISLLR